ncbi:MAG TPA: M24 family metallopeptidase, partial [Candidatus Hodarchaeales archaeon]|nr:M24 family metallopeptidase [Candidatus Hodarchaeales archaeon]
RGIETVISKVKIGMTEKEIAVMVANELSERTGELVPFNLVQVGQNSAIPHAQATDKKLQNGDVLLVDVGTTFKYYYGDITNTTIIGRPNKKFLEIYDLVEEANRRAFEASKAGAIPEEVDQAARSFLESKGYGKYFTHRTGHGIGLDGHEDPHIAKDNKTPLETSQAHSVEPGIYISTKFGVRIEDDVIVRAGKSERACQPVRLLWEKA